METNIVHSGLKIKEGDYTHALLHLAWFREGQQRYLIFGMVELFPTEFPPSETSDEIDFRVTAFGGQHCIYVRRFAMTADAAICWYSNCMNGEAVIPAAPGQPQGVKLRTTSFQNEPPWPHLITTRSLPFQCWGTVRAHHLLQSAPPTEIMKILTHTDAVRWLSDRLFFEFVEYPEWFGSVSLIAPNPVFREFHQTLGIHKSGAETSDCNFIVRAGKSLLGLTLYLTEHRPTGIAGLHKFEVDKTYIQIPHIGRTEQVSFVIASSDYGVLEWHDPVGFIRSINSEFGIIAGKKVVTVPDESGRPGETYEQSFVEHGISSLVGESGIASPITSQFHSAKRERDRRVEAERLDQKWFHGDEQEARIFIRRLIESARHRVTIIDPYFASIEMFRFALATGRSEVTVRIMTAAEENLKKPDRLDPSKEAGEVFLSQVKALDHMGHFEVLVMTGTPQVHDRFLVIDDAVWLSGNSLHSIGERAGMIIKLPNPGVVLDELEKIMNGPRVKALESWVQMRLTEKERSAANKAE